MPTKSTTVKKVPAVAAAAKATPKKAVKKAAPKKKAVKKQAASPACVCGHTCRPEEAFWVNNGPIVSTVAELKGALMSMSDEQYAHHARSDGNDFACWIRDCMGDARCADRLLHAKTRADAVRTLCVSCA